MPSYFDEGQGFFVRTPSWHKLESKVLDYWPPTWAEARVEANLLWEPEPQKLYIKDPELTTIAWPQLHYKEVPGWVATQRSDTKAILGVQTDAYRIITHAEFGEVLETVRGTTIGAESEFEGVFTLHGGKLVIAVLRDPVAQAVPGDPSPTVRYLVVCIRHDGQGGLKIIRTNIRVVCANTWGMAEHGAEEEKTSFVIKHTANWDARAAEIRDKLATAEKANEKYYEHSKIMAQATITTDAREAFLAKFIPIGSDMTERTVANREADRDQIRQILAGPTCEGISGTVYGLVQAGGEFADHYRGFRTASSYVTRTLVNKEPLKMKAWRLGRQMAGIR